MASKAVALKKTGWSATKREAPKLGTPKLPADKVKRSVSMVTAGGYTVFSSPVRPLHRTARQIADAIADLD